MLEPKPFHNRVRLKTKQKINKTKKSKNSNNKKTNKQIKSLPILHLVKCT